MNLNDRYFPYPVLAPGKDDYKNSKFSAHVNIEPEEDTFKINVQFTLKNDYLWDLNNKDFSSFALMIVSTNTRYRNISFINNESNTLEIPRDKFDGKVIITPLILATKDFDLDFNPSLHADYKGYSFSIKKGDILGIGKSISFDATVEFDSLKNVPSIFTIQKRHDRSKVSLDVDLSYSSKIIIRLDKETFDNYYVLKQYETVLAKILSGIVVLPALVRTLEAIFEQDQDVNEFEDFRWFKVIAKRLKDLGYPISKWSSLEVSTIEIAQELIGNPISSGLIDLKGVISRLEGEGVN